jgi:hypothetical protein
MLRTAAALTGLALLAVPLAAQVGHAPASSPYRDILHGKSLTLLYGDVAGDGGDIGIGPHNGPSYAARIDVRLGAPIQFALTVGKANLKRLIVSAADSVHDRVDGPVSQRVWMVEAGLQLNLTGKKTWHHLAPFVGVGAGWARGSSLSYAQDSSGYAFKSKLFLAPSAGLRILLGQSLQLRLEARQLFWKLSYPASYNREPAAEPSTDPAKSNAVLPGNKSREWTGGRELRAGLGFSF